MFRRETLIQIRSFWLDAPPFSSSQLIDYAGVIFWQAGGRNALPSPCVASHQDEGRCTGVSAGKFRQHGCSEIISVEGRIRGNDVSSFIQRAWSEVKSWLEIISGLSFILLVGSSGFLSIGGLGARHEGKKKVPLWRKLLAAECFGRWQRDQRYRGVRIRENAFITEGTEKTSEENSLQVFSVPSVLVE